MCGMDEKIIITRGKIPDSTAKVCESRTHRNTRVRFVSS